jgi:hypothetical protein
LASFFRVAINRHVSSGKLSVDRAAQLDGHIIFGPEQPGGEA